MLCIVILYFRGVKCVSVLLCIDDEKCDVWSVGIIAYILLSGRFPFDGITNKDVFDEINHKKLTFDDDVFNGVSESAKDFISLCLSRNAALRPTAEEALKHSWFKNVNRSSGKGAIRSDIIEKMRGT